MAQNSDDYKRGLTTGLAMQPLFVAAAEKEPELLGQPVFPGIMCDMIHGIYIPYGTTAEGD